MQEKLQVSLGVNNFLRVPTGHHFSIEIFLFVNRCPPVIYDLLWGHIKLLDTNSSI